MRILITGIVTILILGLLLWEHVHDGVPSHHILHQKDMPEISNWWSGLFLPILTWILVGKIINRIEKQATPTKQDKPETGNVLILFGVGLAFGIILAVSFMQDYKPFLDNVLYILLILSLIAPIFYSEFILGFVLGMTYTFGALIPTVFILIMASIGFIVFRFIRPLCQKAIRAFGI